MRLVGRKQVINEWGFVANPMEDFKFYGGGKGGSSGGGGTVYIPAQTTPTYNAPVAAPRKDEEASLELADESDEELIQKKALKQGARSLRIPLGTGL